MSENAWTPVGAEPVRLVADPDYWMLRFQRPDLPTHEVQVDIGVEALSEGDAKELGGRFEVWALMRTGVWNDQGEYVYEALGWTLHVAPTKETASALAQAAAEDWHRDGAGRIDWEPPSA